MRRTWKFDRGRYQVILWAPVVFTFEREDEDGWSWIGWAWIWKRPKRWKFPHDPAASRCPVILQGFTCGPLDVRRFRPEWEDSTEMLSSRRP